MKIFLGFSVMCFKITISILAWIVFICFVIPGIIVVFLPLYFVKHFLIVPIAVKINSDFLEPLSPHDEVMGQDDFYGTKSYANLMIAVILDGHIDVNKLRACFIQNVINRLNEKGEKIHEKLLRFPVQFWGYLFWKKMADLDINHHIREDKSPVTKAEFQEFCSHLITAPYCVNKPLWEITVHTFYEGNKSAVTVKIHHSVADGLTFMKMLDFLIDSEPLKYEAVNYKKNKLTWWKMVNLILKAPVAIGSLYLGNMFQRNHYSRFKSSDEAIVSWTSIPTNELKLIKKQFNMPFAAAGLVTFTGTLLRLDNLDTTNDLRVVLPMPWEKHRNDTMSNNWTAVFVQVPCKYKQRTDWVEAIKNNLIYTMESGSIVFAGWSIFFLSLLPRPVLNAFMYSGYNGFFLAYTTVPGRYNEDIFIDGNLVLEMIPLPGLQYRHGSTMEGLCSYTFSPEILSEEEAQECELRKDLSYFAKSKLEIMEYSEIFSIRKANQRYNIDRKCVRECKRQREELKELVEEGTPEKG